LLFILSGRLSINTTYGKRALHPTARTCGLGGGRLHIRAYTRGSRNRGSRARRSRSAYNRSAYNRSAYNRSAYSRKSRTRGRRNDMNASHVCGGRQQCSRVLAVARYGLAPCRSPFDQGAKGIAVPQRREGHHYGPK
jgi:hypothetical protein